MKNILHLLLFFFFISHSCRAQSDQFNEIALNHQLMGASVVAICQGEILFTEHYGLRNYANALPVDDSTLYRIASISKLVTAIGLMQLHEDGLFNLDDDISTAMGYSIRNPLYPDVPITFRMLLSHQSSLQDGSGYSPFLTSTYDQITNPPNVAALITPEGNYYTSDMWRTETPGTFFTYSNLNFGLIGTLIEKLSNQRFDVFMKTNVLNVLNVSGSYNVTDIANINNLATLYRNIGGNWTPTADNFQGADPLPYDLTNYLPGTNGLIFAPQGGLRISALDLARFAIEMQNALNNESSDLLLNQSTWNLMFNEEWLYNGSNGDNYYGLFNSWGLGTQRITAENDGDQICNPDYSWFGHAGEAYGLISDMYVGSPASSGNISSSGLVFITNGSFEGYSFGSNSSFYQVEEDVYGMLCSYFSTDCVTGLDEVTGKTISVFPNPSYGQLSANFENAANGDWVLMDLLGNIIFKNTISSSQINLNLNDLPSGSYILSFKNETTSTYTHWQKID
jgi:CubicO group peptidase (beta-lactamase class C family)